MTNAIQKSDRMKNFGYIVLSVLLGLTACASKQEVYLPVQKCAPIPVGRASACACALDGKGYVFSGRDADGNYLNDLWQYDPQTDTWTDLGVTPLRPRVHAAMIAYDGALYLGLGFASGKIYMEEYYLHDWWRWSPATGKWDSLAAYPDKTTIAPTLYQVDERIYAIYGSTSCFSRDIRYYLPQTNEWCSIAESHLRAYSAFCGVGATCHGKTYYGLGFNTGNLTQWYTMDLPSDKWTACRKLPAKGREYSACGVGKDNIYVFGGRYFGGEYTGGEVFAEIWRYSPDADRWTYCGEMPGGRAENQIAFSINGKVYFGLGRDEKGTVLNTLYRIED